MESIEELIKRINRNTVAQIEQIARFERWAIDMGLAPPKIQEREPTELQRLIQAWELPLPEPRREEPPLPEPRGEEPPLPAPICPWFPAPLSPSTQTSLGCCQTSLLLPLFAASLPLGDRTSLHQSPGEDLCPLMHPPVPRSTLRSPLLNCWVPLLPVRGPYMAGPGCGPIHPQVRPWKRAEKVIDGLEGAVRNNHFTKQATEDEFASVTMNWLRYAKD
ncbi:UNVERIFIED_CONTAM: hypothetical protein FKN15_059932 [Acipenser sinensis]